MFIAYSKHETIRDPFCNWKSVKLCSCSYRNLCCTNSKWWLDSYCICHRCVYGIVNATSVRRYLKHVLLVCALLVHVQNWKCQLAWWFKNKLVYYIFQLRTILSFPRKYWRKYSEYVISICLYALNFSNCDHIFTFIFTSTEYVLLYLSLKAKCDSYLNRNWQDWNLYDPVL